MSGLVTVTFTFLDIAYESAFNGVQNYLIVRYDRLHEFNLLINPFPSTMIWLLNFFNGASLQTEAFKLIQHFLFQSKTLLSVIRYENKH